MKVARGASSLNKLYVDYTNHTITGKSMTPYAQGSTYQVTQIRKSKPIILYENRFMVIFTNANGVESPGIYSQFPNEFESPNLVVFPNPVENGKLNFRFNNYTEGLYSVKLISSTGQLVYQGTLSVSNKVATTSLNIVQKLAKGSYELILIDSKGKSFTRKVIFN